MAKSQPRYTPEFRRQMVGLHRTGRKLEELAKEFGVTSWTIRQWIKRADRDGGERDGGLMTGEREELTRLKRQVAPATPGAGDSLKSRGLVCERESRNTKALFEFVSANQAVFSVRVMCRLLGISKSGFMRGVEGRYRRAAAPISA